jgi:hypothetical protein
MSRVPNARSVSSKRRDLGLHVDVGRHLEHAAGLPDLLAVRASVSSVVDDHPRPPASGARARPMPRPEPVTTATLLAARELLPAGGSSGGRHSSTGSQDGGAGARWAATKYRAYASRSLICHAPTMAPALAEPACRALESATSCPPQDLTNISDRRGSWPAMSSENHLLGWGIYRSMAVTDPAEVGTRSARARGVRSVDRSDDCGIGGPDRAGKGHPRSGVRELGTNDFSIAIWVNASVRPTSLGDLAAFFDPSARRGFTLGFRHRRSVAVTATTGTCSSGSMVAVSRAGPTMARRPRPQS